jgi:hypothetical protein
MYSCLAENAKIGSSCRTGSTVFSNFLTFLLHSRYLTMQYQFKGMADVLHEYMRLERGLM